MSDDLILGIDGGGTKMLAALADRSGRVLRMVRGGGVNPMDNPAWRQEMDRTLASFLAEPGLVSVAAGLPVYGEVARLSDLLREAIAESFPHAKQRVMNDVDAAHLGAFIGKPGILILSGTGSMAWARDRAGRALRVGGWGDVIGDEGSSYWIGRAALALVSQSLDGRAPPTALVEALFETLGLDRSDPINALAGWVTDQPNPRPAIAALSMIVDRIAESGDAPAIGLIEGAADELFRHVQAAERQSEPGLDWSYAGGTFSSRLLREALQRRIGRAPLAARLSPIGGALLAAAESLGWSTDDDWLGQIAATVEAAAVQSGEDLKNKERREHA